MTSLLTPKPKAKIIRAISRTKPVTTVRQASVQGKRARAMDGLSQGAWRRGDSHGSGTPAWCIHVAAGQSIAANRSEITVGMKIAWPRYRARTMLNRMAAFNPQRLALLRFMLITNALLHPRSRKPGRRPSQGGVRRACRQASM